MGCISYREKSALGNLQILTGARIEHTHIYNIHNIMGPPYSTWNIFDYYDVLPSLHLTYQANEKQNIRFSVYKAINRPEFYEIMIILILGYNTNMVGNPLLKHSTGTCFDLRYEAIS